MDTSITTKIRTLKVYIELQETKRKIKVLNVLENWLFI